MSDRLESNGTEAVSEKHIALGSRARVFLKEIFFTKGSLMWKLPLIYYIWQKFEGKFTEYFGALMLLFIAQKRSFFFSGNPEFREAYSSIFQRNFYETGIDLIIYEIFSLLVVLLFAFIIDRYSSEELGIKINVKAFFLFLLGVIFAFTVVSFINSILIFNGNLKLEGLSIKENVIPHLQIKLFFQAVLFMLVAFQEEFFARAYIVNNIRWAGKTFCIIFGSMLFAMFHLSNTIESKTEAKKVFIFLVVFILSILIKIAVQHQKKRRPALLILPGLFATAVFVWICIDILLKKDIAIMLGIINIGLLAVLFVLYFLRYSDLWLLIGAHFSWNFTMGPFYGTTVSKIETLNGVSILKSNMSGATYLTGGSFGPEGSIVTTIVILVILGISLYIGRRRQIRVEQANL